MKNNDYKLKIAIALSLLIIGLLMAFCNYNPINYLENVFTKINSTKLIHD